MVGTYPEDETDSIMIIVVIIIEEASIHMLDVQFPSTLILLQHILLSI